MTKTAILSKVKGDIFGGVTAAVVALPLALAFGVASGAGAIAGLYGAIAVGFFAAIFGGTPAQVSGPTGPMTVVMAAVVAQYADNLTEAFAIVFLGGAIQVVLGLIRVGQFVSYTPYSVVSGFMSGIGVIIILIQTLPFVGLAAAGGPIATIEHWPAIMDGINPSAVALATMALGIMVFWPRRLAGWLPAPLAALIAGTLIAYFFLQDVPIIGEVPMGLPSLVIPSFPISDLPQVIQAALVLALLGSIDSLLTSLVADALTRTRHNSNRELIGQGIGNMVAGLIGGLPGAGATMRTVVNIRAGGHTPISGALHSLVLLAMLLGLGPLAEQVPHAVLAGILMKVGWDIIDWSYLKRIRRAPREKVLVMLITLGLTVFVDLITAVAAGLIMAGFVTSRWMEREEMKGVIRIALPEAGEGSLTEEERGLLNGANGDIELVSLRGNFSYASARQLSQRFAAAQDRKAIIYDFTEAAYIDTSAALSIESLLESARAAGVDVFVSGLAGTARKTLDDLDILSSLAADRVFDQRFEAINAAVRGTLGGRSGP